MGQMVMDWEETSWTKFSYQKVRVTPEEEDMILWSDTDLGARRLGFKAHSKTEEACGPKQVILLLWA